MVKERINAAMYLRRCVNRNGGCAAIQQASQSFFEEMTFLEKAVADFYSTVRDSCWTAKIVVRHGSFHKPTHVTLDLRTDNVFQVQHSRWKPDNE